MNAFEVTYSILIALVVISIVWVASTCPKCGKLVFLRRHKSHIPPSPADKTTLRIYHNGQVIIGPMTLSDLALMAKYGYFDKDASMLYPGHYVRNEGFDMSMEWEESK